MQEYKLRAELHGHSKDVKALCVGFLPELVIVSGSRDYTTRLWTPFEGDNFQEIAVLPGNGCFVNSVAVIPAGASCPDGLVLVGGQDTFIRAFSAAVPHDIVYTLEGHEKNVCSLSVDFDRELLISGSWDTTAKIWKGKSCVATLKGHEHAVWDAVPVPTPREQELPLVLTCSADKSIILWNNDKIVRRYKGHKDTVRSLCVLNEATFVSCSNDCSIVMWDLNLGHQIKSFEGHTCFVYRLAALPNCEGFVSCGEDGCVRVWTEAGLKQCIQLPSSSVWSVATLPNGDIVTGGSDAIVRIFTNDCGKVADSNIVTVFDSDVKAFVDAQACPDEIGGVKVQDLPSKEALNEPGSRDGQTKLVRSGKAVQIYSWQSATKEWTFVGNYAGEPEAKDGKKKYKGQEYDYVFEVDVDDNRPQLKLPYNKGDDPYLASQKFIDANGLPQDYLDQVAHFILKNVPNSSPAAPAGNYVDPLTGAGRYIPGSTGDTNGREGGADPYTGEGRYIPGSGSGMFSMNGGTDPYTGEGRYVPQGGQQATLANSNIPIDRKRPRGDDMPLRDYKTWTVVSADKLMGKLSEFNHSQQINAENKLSEQQLQALKQLASGNDKDEDVQIAAIITAIYWHKECLVPVFDLMRLLLLRRSCSAELLAFETRGPQVLQIVCYQLEQAVDPSLFSPPMQIVLCRVLMHAIMHTSSRKLIMLSQVYKFDTILSLVTKCISEATKPAAQLAAASVVANCALAIHQGEIDSACRKQILDVLVPHLTHIFIDNVNELSPEALFVVIQSLVTLLWGQNEIINYAKDTLKLLPVAARMKDLIDGDKGKFVARALEQMMID